MGGCIMSSSPEASKEMMAPVVLMMLRMMMMAHRVMMRCLFDVLTPLSLVKKGGVVLR